MLGTYTFQNAYLTNIIINPVSQSHRRRFGAVFSCHFLPLQVSLGKSYLSSSCLAMASRCLRSLRPRGRVTFTTTLQSCKFHSAVAKITTIDSQGMPVSRETGIMIGEPDENFVYVEPEVGNTFKSAIIQQIGTSGASKHSEVCETLPLQFNHDSKDFSHSKKLSIAIVNLACIDARSESLPHPRIAIGQNLGHAKGKVSSATLWLSGNWHAITLDGTPDGQYSEPNSLILRISNHSIYSPVLQRALNECREKAASN